MSDVQGRLLDRIAKSVLLLLTKFLVEFHSATKNELDEQSSFKAVVNINGILKGF